MFKSENQLHPVLERLFPEAIRALQQMMREPSHHAWCIAGVEQGGQHALALYASRLLASSPADIHTMESEDGSATIGVEHAQKIHTHLHRTPLGTRNVALIHHAEQLTPAAVNALLKLIEEPPSHSALILDTAAWGLLPITLRSRLHVLHLPTPSRAQLRTAVEAVSPLVVSFNTLIENTHGRVDDILACLTDASAIERFQHHSATAQCFLSATILEREQILTTVEDLGSFLEQCLHIVKEQPVNTNGRSTRLTVLLHLQRMLSHHVNKKLICDYLIVRL